GLIPNHSERRAVKIVGARLSGVVQDSVGAPAILCRISAGLNFELLDALGADHAHLRVVAALAHGLSTIQQQARAVTQASGDSDVGAGGVRVASEVENNTRRKR